MISSTVTIQLYPAEGRQWATVAVEGADDPTLALASGQGSGDRDSPFLYYSRSAGHTVGFGQRGTAKCSRAGQSGFGQ